jgi:hypothetical protein
VKRDPRFVEQNYSYCKKYYTEVFKHYHETMPKDHFLQIFGETFATQGQNMMDIVPEITIWQFIENLSKDE